MSTQGSDEFSLPQRCGYVQLQCGQNGRLPDVVSGHTRNESDRVSYDSLGTVRTDPSSSVGSVTINAVSNGQYDLSGSVSSTPYITSVTLIPTQQSETRSNEGNQSPGCSCTRKMMIGLGLTLIGFLVGAGIASAIILITQTGSSLNLKGETSTLVTSSTKTTSANKPSTTETTFGSTYQEKNTETATDITTSAQTDPRISSTIATEVTSSNPTLTAISTTVCFRKCHACGSGNRRCPADGNITGNDPGEVTNCPCDTACFSEIRAYSGVQRGCAGDFPKFDERSRENMTCQHISESFVCFCLGEKCNKHNMTGYSEYKTF